MNLSAVCSPPAPNRLDAAAKAKIPAIVAPGCLDMVNFGERASVPAKFAGRTFYQHNPQVTLMRTTPVECTELGRIIAEKINRYTAPVTALLLLRAISIISAPGQPFHDPAADAASSLLEGIAFALTSRSSRTTSRSTTPFSPAPARTPCSLVLGAPAPSPDHAHPRDPASPPGCFHHPVLPLPPSSSTAAPSPVALEGDPQMVDRARWRHHRRGSTAEKIRAAPSSSATERSFQTSTSG